MPFSMCRYGLCLLVPLALYGAAPPAPRERVTISQGWRFTIDVENIGEREQWYRPGFDFSDWSKVVVPKAWDLYEEGLWGYEGVSWFAVSLDGSLARSGKLQTLRFGRVMYHTRAWLNSELLGENVGGYLPFEFDVSGKLKAGQANILMLRVDNKPRLRWLPAARNIEWMQYGGILEPVVLETTARTYLSDVTIRAEPEGAGAAIDCRLEVTAREAVPAEYTLLVAAAGATASAKVTVAPGPALAHSILLRLPRVGRWSPATPNLYVLRAELRRNGQLVDGRTERFGVRKVETSGRRILLNGEPLYVKGVNRYDEYGRFGPNAPRHLVVEDLRRMKAAGINFIRVHFPQSPELISLYDEMGFLMMEEVTLNWWGNGFSGQGEEVQREDILEFAIPFLERMIRRDKNHPSVVFWSMRNESATDNEVGIKVMRTLLHRAKQLDPTRLVTFVLATRESRGHLAFENTDFVSVNVYVGGGSRVADVRRIVPKEAAAYLQRQVDTWPGKPVLVTEFGTQGVPGVHGDVSYTEEFQAAFIEEVWAVIRRCKDVSGGVLWSWADYFHRPNYIKYAPFGPYGVVTVDRRPKLALQSLVKMYGGGTPLTK